MAEETKPMESRRRALVKLGLTAAIAYSAPTLIRVDRSANATVLPTPCGPPGSSHGNSHGHGGGDDDDGGSWGGGCPPGQGGGHSWDD
ncbi:hypothetical protein SAMN06265365_12293 [Tistlia consotensis]|uniref:Uncharacterized protein n=1 Tax=Tistlia consotensis USBA 355 TaxID=560819 RepID=A0A1Y6CG92_9PROT|nr:hypothetical protein [Tistlia consotensis]SMF63269.1 hypothetical protein SAMN05428998_12493 [Tistlia consotensis USBA 355]SNR95982.1 hypothetical protein SAMN06265365_12293 [Tistlia consotensis]